MAKQRVLDISKVESALKKAAKVAVSGDRTQRSGIFTAASSKKPPQASNQDNKSSQSKR
ncbi:MAG: hypothetical protein ABL901_04240 [Hyphomicrobiaceae bacterium]